MKPLGLYIHIPFCRQKCGYCSFYSVCELDKIRGYIEALKENIRKKASLYGDYCVDSIYIGGGTPSLIGADALSSVLEEIKSRFSVSLDCEITSEANPDSADNEFLQGALKAGVNRLSLGVQSFCDRELVELSRLHSSEKAYSAVENAKAAGFNNINIDIMLDVPYSNLTSLKDTLNTVIELSPRHISAYCLKIEEGTPFYNKNISLRSDDYEFDMYESVHNILCRNGYEHYEISGFSKPGGRCRHNLKYWTGGDYLGLGCAAHSLVAGKRFYETADVDDYTSGKSRMETEEALDPIFEYIMLAPRLRDGINLKYLNKALSTKEFESFVKCAGDIEKYGYGKLSVDNFSLNYKGMFISNTIIIKLADSIGR